MKATFIPATSYTERDRGRPGRGPRLIPIRRKGDMNKIAKEMGYASATDVPEQHIDAYVRKLVKRYGERSIRGKIQAMITVRKRTPGPARRKFEMMIASLDNQYMGGGWRPAA